MSGYRSENVLEPSVCVAMHCCLSHPYEETLPPDFVIGNFQINKHGNRIFVHLESIFSLLCESDQWVFCGMVTPEARLARCDVVVFETFLIILSTSFPMHDVSDIGL